MPRLRQDIRFALRTLAKSPSFTAVALLTLALGIGVNTAIFTIAYATLLAPSPYPQSDRLVNVWSKLRGTRNWVSAGDFADWKSLASVFDDLNASSPSDFDIATQGSPEFVDGLEATQGYYAMLGGSLFLGRNFFPAEGEPGREHVVILTNRLWRHLGANPQIIGHDMQINGEPYTVVGVLAPGVADRWDEELIVPLVFKPEQLNNHDARYWLITGRLKRGVSAKQAQAEMNAVAAEEAKAHPKSDQGWGALVEPFTNDFLTSDRRLTLWMLLAAVGFLLLIACLNVANLLLAQGITRQKEVAIRSSLGAKPTEIFALFLTESLSLAILGGILGVIAGNLILRGLVAVIPPHSLPAEADLRLNAPILLIMLAVSTTTGVLFGCVPAWYASRSNPSDLLKDGHSGIGIGRSRFRRAIVVAEFALALPLLAGAGLAIRSFWNLTHIDLGVRTDHVLGFYLYPQSLMKDPQKLGPYYRSILSSIASVPGVSNVCAMSYLPLDSLHAEMPFTISGRTAYSNPSLRPSADLEMVTPDYFRTFGIRILKGRGFDEDDNASSPKIAMVNEVFARRFLARVDPLQQHVVMEQVMPYGPLGPAVEWQIVGVFHTVKSRGSREDNPEIDVPFWQEAYRVSGIGVRTVQNPTTMVKEIAAAVNSVDPQAALYMPRTMEQVHDEVLANDRFEAFLFGGLAGVALLLAVVGIQGVTAFSVAQRSHEIAIRMALGAPRGRVVALLMKDALMSTLAGLALGLIGAYLVGRAMQGILFGVGVIDFPTLGAVGLILFFSALLASYVPARRGTRLDPLVALRYQ